MKEDEAILYVEELKASVKREYKYLHAALMRMPYTLAIPGIQNIPKYIVKSLIPLLKDRGYRLDQPVFYSLLADKPKLQAEIFNPAIYSRRPIMVEGIFTASVHRSDLYRKNIIILGDEHSPRSNCPRSIVISDYITQILTANPRKVFDIFVESDYNKGEKLIPNTNEQGFMFGQLQHQFQHCLKVDKSRCPYKNLRMHYTDMRFYTGPIGFELGDILGFMLYGFARASGYSNTEVSQQLANLYRCKSITERLIEAIKVFARGGDTYITTKNDITSWVLEKFKIGKQLRKSPYPHMREHLYTYIQTQMPEDGKLEEFLEHINDLIRKIKTPGVEETYDTEIRYYLRNMLNTYDSIFNFIVAIMDGYLLTRMFSKFNGTTDDVAEPHNIIIIAGDAHCQNYRNFLDRYTEGTFVNIGKTRLATSGSDDKCIDMSQFPLH